jgi:cellulose synthase/poly-beta-1,6-N-acetylglucosamine synthase-like glycosyltransferase
MSRIISYLIPALNEERHIGNCIGAIKSYTPAGFEAEIIVGDHGSTDRTAAIAAAAGARVAPFRGGTIATLRNFLVTQSTGWLIVFVDADVCITPQWGAAIEGAIAGIEREPRQITGSRCSAPDSDNFIVRDWFAAMPPDNHSYLGTGHIIFTRQACDEIGGFDANLRTGEDFDFCMRAQDRGYALNINPQLRVVHYDYPQSLGAFIRRERWHGSGDFQSVSNLLKSKIALLTLVFIALHVAALATLLLAPLWTPLWLASLGLMMLGLSLVKFPRLGAATRMRNAFVFYCYLLGRSWSLASQLWRPRNAA